MKHEINQTIKDILQEAGLYHRQLLEFNDVNSSVISLGDYTLADVNGDDTIDVKDVRVLVDNKLVKVTEVDTTNALITLEKPVVSGQEVSVRFASSSVEPEYVEKVRAEALSEIISKIPCDAAWIEEYKPTLRYIQRLMAASMLLVRDYGFNEDIENTSKDGYKKLELANEKLSALIAAVCGGTQARNAQGFAARDDGDLFEKKPHISSEDSLDWRCW